jgi:hypothetical protein
MYQLKHFRYTQFCGIKYIHIIVYILNFLLLLTETLYPLKINFPFPLPQSLLSLYKFDSYSYLK